MIDASVETLDVLYEAQIGGAPEHSALGGGLEGAERTDRETTNWNPSMRSPDQAINTAKPMADARGRDMVQNDGYANGAVATHKDSIVGGHYRLNCRPNWRVLAKMTGFAFDDKWSEEFQQVVESRFDLIAESDACYLDAAGMNTLTGLTRLAVGGFVMTGEVLSSAEWDRSVLRPVKTCVQMVSPDRLSNPNGEADTRYLRRGVRRNYFGKPLAYCIRNGHPSDVYDLQSYTWKEVPATKPWGRKQIIHIIEQLLPDQSRGVADMVAALKQMRMTKNFQEITLQNAVVNASYAAAIESELPPEAVAAMMGGNNGADNYAIAINQFMSMLGAYVQNSSNISIDGAKIPHLFPGTKLSMKPMGTPGGVGTEFEQSLLRHIAAALGLSYEEFSRDFSKVSYSSARASMLSTWRFMQSRKKMVADRFATGLYALVLEEEMGKRNVPLPAMSRRQQENVFYLPLAKEAFTRARWIGAGRGQIDEVKETQAAIMRINAKLSTREIEIAKLGEDFRETFEQLEKEDKLAALHGIDLSPPTTAKPGAKDRQNTTAQNGAEKKAA